MASNLPVHVFDALVNHVTLPPRLPFKNDNHGGATERALAQRLARQSHAFRSNMDPRYYHQWSIICRALDRYVTLHGTSGNISGDTLKSAFNDISNSDGDYLIAHIATQNAGLIIRKGKSNDFIFEAFEASPRAADVLASSDALQWDFPGHAVAIPSETFTDPEFQKCIVRFLEQASIENVKDFAAATAKAGSRAFESRDTANPALISQLFMALLEANGSVRATITTRKRVRDDVCWNDGAENPWRRSAAWLVLRVALQRSLCLLFGDSIGFFHYKFFISSFIARLCDDMTEVVPIKADFLAHARAKLARRLAKLRIQQKMAPPDDVPIIENIFTLLDKGFNSTLRAVNDRLASTWIEIRRQSQKRIPRLAKRADDGSLVLSLFHSREHLQQLCGLPSVEHQPLRRNVQNYAHCLTTYSTNKTESSQQGFDVSRYLGLAEFELQVELHNSRIWPSCLESTHEQCSRLADKIQNYQHTALSAYNSNPEQSSLMLLTIMELWTALDSMALQLFPLLTGYGSGFPIDILNVLQIARLSDLRRLQAVEMYLRSRQRSSNATLPSIFSDPSETCFAVQYFDQCKSMQELRTTIILDGHVAKDLKKQEWEEKSAKYEDLLKSAAETSCLYNNWEDKFGEVHSVHDDQRCQKHYLERAAKRVKIAIHEHPLPEDQDAAKAAVFELTCPRAFSAYRDTTWNIINTLGRGLTFPEHTPKLLLRDYSGLQNYGTRRTSVISLASRTKSFLDTHYAQVGFPVSLEKVCLPNGLQLRLYDQKQKLWTSRQSVRPSFRPLCTSSLSSKSSFSSLEPTLQGLSDGDAQSPNEILASQTECPASLTVFEYLGFQELGFGTKLRWLQLLRELASPNLNFGTSATVTLVCQLALQVGGPWKDDILRVSHWVFKDDFFCLAFVAQLKKRLQAILTNWRESQTLECLITLIQRLWELGESTEVTEQAATLLIDVRVTTLGWVRSLGREVLAAIDGKTAETRSRDALWAALLCRRTYVLEIDNASDCLEPEALSCFIECSVALNDNMPETGPNRISKLPLPLRSMFIRDLKIVHRLKSKLYQSILSTSSAVDRAMNNIWPEPADAPSRAFTPWDFLPAPHETWISAQSVGTDGVRSQNVHYNTVEGILLVDGQRLGKLPDEYAKGVFVQQFLGGRLYLTYPSAVPGMEYMLASLIEGNQVHLGVRDGVPFMRALFGYEMLELIRPEVFRGPNNNAEDADFPMPLINGHVHWLNLKSGILQITPRTSMWRSKFSDWKLEVWTGHARRRNSQLVDVRSSVFQRIAGIIEPFQHRSEMIIFQPEKRNLTVNLPKFEMTFTVNFQGLLESRQLQAVIDDNQDAGTLYGLESKLVLRDISNSTKRSIAVAIGSTALQRYMGHVRVRIQHPEHYCRFSINTVLNRLECPAEPRVVYMKAYCHAITTFVLADPLTGRTGTEEALHSLSSGISQPWAPVDEEAYRLLSCIADLTPRRVYYPMEMKVMQNVFWTESLLFQAQDDRFHPAVSGILRQCRLLYRFNSGAREPPHRESISDLHLLERARVRNCAHRLSWSVDRLEKRSDIAYLARDRVSSASRANAFEAATLIKRWSRRIAVSSDLATLLQSWPVIQGYQEDQSFQLYLLDELINLDVASHWGSLFRYCQELHRTEDLYKAIFFFATVSFGRKADMVVVRTLIAFTVMGEFQSLSGPEWGSFTEFRKGQVPTVDYLVDLMSPSILAYPQDERSLIGGISLNTKQRRKLEMAQFKYEKETKEGCKSLAKYLLSQWPCQTPSPPNHNDYQNINLESASLLVQSKWQLLFKNYELSAHLQDVQRILDLCRPATKIPVLESKLLDQGVYPTFSTTSVVLTLQHVMNEAESHFRSDSNFSSVEADGSHVVPPSIALEVPRPQQPDPAQPDLSLDSSQNALKRAVLEPVETSCPELIELQNIVWPLLQNENTVRRAYGEYLHKSLAALRDFKGREVRELRPVDHARLVNALPTCQEAIKLQFDIICRNLTRNSSFVWLSYGGLWPNLTPITLLETLGSNSSTKCSGRLKDAVVTYGELITMWQRLMRIDAAINNRNTLQLREQLENEGHVEWRPMDHPDWLLLEIENNILIRNDQYRVAKAMIEPASGSNSVLQMNMGQGKSSVIIPMIAAVLANKRQLFRVIVPKPLLLQMAQLLQARLGGLLGRTVKHMPFSRRSSTAEDNVKAYWDLHRETLNVQGIILALPEHLLSFKLSGLQLLSSGKLKEAALMMQVQSWLVSNFRDVLDECDHSLAVKTQLVYPSGAQRMIDGHPDRWKVVQAVLRLVNGRVVQLQRDFPQSVEVTERARSGGFPVVHFLQASAKDALIQLVTESVCRGEGGILPVNDCTKDDLDAVACFLKWVRITKENSSKALNVFKDRQAARQALLLLRGLLVHRILLMALIKRWNVQYGLHPRRDPVAVPFQAKGVPSEQAEFGHPDVAILLTCMSFYYSGLEMTQFEQVLRHVLKSDDPTLDYDQWVQSADSLPDSVRTWAAINVDDELQRHELWSHLRYNMVVINCFLNHFVFPYHAKTFERKLVSSAWDIPLPPQFCPAPPGRHSTTRVHSDPIRNTFQKTLPLTTGFSGTNDNRTLLPLNIEQQDLANLAHTNAEVLTYLLQPRNRRYIFAADILGRRLTEYAFLQLIFKSGIRMLLDAGAQILELDNHSLVKTWLSIDTEAEAAVFFGSDDKARVLYRDGRAVPLVASPFNDNLGACVVYLDEAHTRGTDLKMPASSVAALTLGPGQTKDHTVQGEFAFP